VRKNIKRLISKDDHVSKGKQRQIVEKNPRANSETKEGSHFEGSELFSYFTANIIKEKKVFTR